MDLSVSKRPLVELASLVGAVELAHIFTTRALAMFVFVHYGAQRKKMDNVNDRACVELARSIVALIPAADHDFLTTLLEKMDAENAMRVAPRRRSESRRSGTNVPARRRRLH